MTVPVDSGPNLLLDWHRPATSPRLLRAGVGSIAAHAVIVSVLIFLVSLDAGRPDKVPELTQVRRIIVPLIAPPTKLTQKEPIRTKVAKEVKLENLLAEREVTPRIPALPAPPPKLFLTEPPVPTPPPQKLFKAPPQNLQPPTPKPLTVAQPLQEPPRIEATLRPLQNLPQSPSAQPPPPPKPIQPVEKPKLVLEAPGQGGSAPEKGGMVKIPVPKATVEDALHSVARGGGQGGIVVGDADQTPSLGDTLRRPAAPRRNAENLEMISDPMGADFKPYLIRILAKVRQNWFAVIPESVHLGRSGKVVLQFAIDRSGGVPKLVIEMPSGVEALDKAAIAGISASVPFPPLPKEFPGQQIRLKFAFQYNQ